MRAVIYARFSSDNQREESIEGQIRECMEYAERNGITVVGNYIDRALSAKTDNRPNFQKMIKDSYKGLFDLVIVWKLDRFARNRYDSAHYKTILKKNGVKVVSARESIAEGSEGILLESVLEGYAEYFSADLAEKVNRGMMENALKCMNNGAGIPLGYYVDDTQHLQIDEKKAPYVREIFQRFADGEMIKTIIADLNARGATISYKLKKSRREVKVYERPLCYNTVRRILSNRKYIGEYKFKDIVVPNGVPAIVEQELFDKVQRRLEQNKKAPAKHKAEDDYLLTTHLFCGKCKSMMIGECGTSHTNKTYRYYKCNSQKRKHNCDKKTVGKDFIEDLIVSAVAAKIMDDELMEHLADSLYALQLTEDTKIPQLKAQLAEIENGIENMLNAIQQGIILDSTKKRLADLEEKKKTVEVELIQEQIKKPILTKEQILFGITKFRTLDLSTKQGRQTLIDSFVNAIYLYDDYALITCNYKDGTIRISLEEIESSDLLSNGVPIPPKPRLRFRWNFYARRLREGYIMQDFFPDYLKQYIQPLKLAEFKSKGQVVCSCGCEEFDYNYLHFKYIPTEEVKKMYEVDKRGREMLEKRIGPYKNFVPGDSRTLAYWTWASFDGKSYLIKYVDGKTKKHNTIEEAMQDPHYIGHVEKSPYDPNEPTEYQYICAQCKRCGKEILLFDDRYYGYDGVCMRYEQPNKPYRTDGKLKTKKPHCDGAGYKIYVTIDSTGKEDLLEGAAPEFINDGNWKDAFGWIKIDIECIACGKKKNALNLETM